MDGLLLLLATNTVLAALLGGIAWWVDRALGRPALAHTLLVVALLALVTPPVVRVGGWGIGEPGSDAAPTDSGSTGRAVSTAHRGDPTNDVPGRSDVDGLVPLDSVARSSRPLAVVPSGVAASDSTPVPIPWRSLLLLAWLAGSVFTLLTLAWRSRALSRLVRSGEPLDPESAAELAAHASEAGLANPPVALRIRSAVPPALATTLRGVRLLLPADWTARYDPAARRALLRHECAHLRRGDHRVRLLEAFVTVLAWWHPLLCWLRAQLRDVEERACDAWVVAGSDARTRRAYCEALLTAASAMPARSLRALALTTGAVRRPPHSPRMRAWSRRLENAMNRETPSRIGPFERAIAALALLVFLPFGIAQDPAAEPPADLLTHLEQTEFAWSVEDALPRQWVEDLTAKIGRPVELGARARAADGESERITGLRLPRTSARRVLDVVATLTDLRWNAVEGRVVFEVPAVDEEGQAGVVHLLGAVKNPGPRKLTEPMTLLDLLRSGGLLDDADTSVVHVLRAPVGTGEEGVPTHLTIDVGWMAETGDTSRNFLFRVGDIVHVRRGHELLPELFLRVGSRLHFVVPVGLAEQPGAEQLALLEETQAVGRDGKIFVPYVGPTYVLGMDQKTVSDVVSKQLSGVFATPLPGSIHRFEARFDPPK